MNQTSLIILLTLIVWSRCDSSLNVPNEPDVVQSDEWESIDEPDQDDNESQAEIEDTDPSASSPVEMVRNQSEINLNLVHFLKNHNIYPQIEQLKRNSNNNNGNLLHQSSATQNNLMSELIRSIVNNSTHPNEDQTKNSANKTYDIGDLKQYYEHVKEGTGSNSPATADGASQQPEFHASHNYFANGDWRPLISTSEHPLASWGQPRNGHQVVPSFSRVPSSEMPTSLANFYVESDRLLHAHESQTNKDLKDVKDTTSSNIATVKDLISTKESIGNKGENKLSSVSHKQGSYVPVEDDKYKEYLTCCEKLFNNYAHKDYYHEDIYLVPKGEEGIYKPPLGPPMMMPHHGGHPGLKPISYLRGYPIVEGDMKLVGRPGKELPPGKHIPVQCLEDRHHSGHLIPAYHGSHPPPMFQPPPPALLLKKKLALIGKKYFFGK